MTDPTDDILRDDELFDGDIPHPGGNGSDPDDGAGLWPVDDPATEPVLEVLDDLDDLDDLSEEPTLDREIAEPSHPIVPLHFAPPRRQAPGGVLWTLVTFMGLDVWGSEFLSRRAALEMKAAAGLLFIVFSFELTAWSLLFNCLIHGSNLALSPYTLLAVLIATFFAAAVFVFERGIVVSDFSVEPARKVLGVAIRLLVIAVSALACAQPLELITFNRAIEARLYLEEILGISTQEYEDHLEATAEAVRPSTADIEGEVGNTVAHAEWVDTKGSRDAAALTVHDLEAQLEQAQREHADREGTVGYWRSRTNRAVADLKADPENADLIARRDHAQNNLDWGRSQAAAAQQRVNDLSVDLNRAHREQEYWDERVEGAWSARGQAHDTINADIDTEIDAASAKVEAIAQRIDVLLAGSPDDPPIDPGTGERFVWSNAGFTDRLCVVQDLVHGHPPRWPATSPEIRAQVIQEFGLPDPEQAALGAERTATTYRRHYVMAFLVAICIPLLTIAFKSILARELRDYYSTVWQALAGNREAVQALIARPGGRELLAAAQEFRPSRLYRRARSFLGGLG